MFLSKHGIKFVNADLIAKELDPGNAEDLSYEAAMMAKRIRDDLMAEGESFCFETVFSHESKIDFIAQAKALGYQIIRDNPFQQIVGMKSGAYKKNRSFTGLGKRGTFFRSSLMIVPGDKRKWVALNNCTWKWGVDIPHQL